MNSKPIIVVAGATGRQGGAVSRQLLRRGWRVRALTRHPDCANAQKLRAVGADVIGADLGEARSLDRALRGADGVFGVTEFWEHGYAGEVHQGTTLVDAAVRAGVPRFVFNSVGGTDRTAELGITHFDSKRVIEEHLRSTSLSWTIFRPVTFFENFVSFRYRSAICRDGVCQFGFKPDKSFQMVAMEDVGSFVVKAFGEPDTYVGKAIELANDRFTMHEFVTALSEVVGRSVRYRYLSLPAQWLITTYVELARKTGHYKVGRSLIAQFRWNNASEIGGWNADLDVLRQLHPDLMTLSQWLRTINWREGMSGRPGEMAV